MCKNRILVLLCVHDSYFALSLGVNIYDIYLYCKFMLSYVTVCHKSRPSKYTQWTFAFVKYGTKYVIGPLFSAIRERVHSFKRSFVK